jgi:hypothetical protein
LERADSDASAAAAPAAPAAATVADHDRRLVVAGAMTEADESAVGDFDRFVRPEVRPPSSDPSGR